MILKFFVVLLSMYLAAVFLNIIQLCRTYKFLTGFPPRPFLILYSFALIVLRPTHVICGLIKAFRDWDWLNNIVYLDENGSVHVKKDKESA